MRILDTKRIYLASETNCDFVLVLEAIFGNTVLCLLVEKDLHLM